MFSRKSVVTWALALTVVAGCSKNAQQYYESGNKYFAAQRFKEAVVEYRNAVQKDPRLGDAHFKLAETYVRLGEPAGAVREYVYAADLLPGSKEAQLKAGTFLMLARRFDDAKARAEKVLKMDPRNLEAQLLLGNATFGLNDLDSAIRQVEEAIQLDPKSGRSYSMLGSMEAARGDAAAAEKAYRQAVEIDPKSAIAHMALGQFLAGSRRQAEAEASFKKAYEIDPKNTLAARALAAFYITSNRAPEAEPYLKGIADNSKEPGPTIALADYYVMMQRTGEAVGLLTKVAANKDAFVDAKVRLAAIQYGEKKTADAYKTIDEVLARDAKNPRALLVKARFLVEEKRVDEALINAKAAVAADPRSAPAQYMLGNLYSAKNKLDEAISAFTEVLKINPRAVAAQLQLARLQMAKGAGEPALQMAEQATTTQQDNPIARLMLARTLMVKGDIARAETELKGLEAKYPKAAAVQASMGSLLLLKNDQAGARKAFEKTIQLDPNSNEALAGLVALDAASKRLPEARARVEARLAKTPNAPAVLILAARTYATAGDLAKAEAMLLRTLEVAPDTLQAYGMLAQLYMAQKKPDEARKKFVELAARQSKPVAAETMIGMILELQGKKAEAQKQYEKVLTIDPRAPVAANNLAWAYAESGGSLDVALQLAQAAKAGLPDATEVDDTLGWIYLKKDLPSQALPLLRECVDKVPQNAAYHYHLGMALVRSGDLINGKRSLEQALKLSQSFDGANEARKTLASLQ
jgi:putative PEP-CTERM system TPR-repeat lipoprotein